ncbi:DUF6397 family protein [Streptomyces cinnamoneus]|uniref:DUF6397 family protein n=1 Tax=Streptomyces cinnamoneus TaxID=53446 RepID=UPI0037B75376
MAVEQCAVRSAGGRGAMEESVPLARAARELGLKPREFELAVQLGEVRTVASGPGGRRRVAREEIERHRATEAFPEALRTRLWVVGTTEGAELLGISPGRFTRLAKAGCFAPVRFYVNRYRVVVWHYLTADLVEFADRSPDLLSGRTPAPLRAVLEKHPDRRARGWRARRLDQLTAQAEDPWQRAAVPAAVLGSDDLADAVPDPGERAYLSALRPALVPARPVTGPARDVVDELVLAQDEDEIEWHRHCLTAALAEARALGQASPAGGVPPGTVAAGTSAASLEQALRTEPSVPVLSSTRSVLSAPPAPSAPPERPVPSGAGVGGPPRQAGPSGPSGPGRPGLPGLWRRLRRRGGRRGPAVRAGRRP